MKVRFRQSGGFAGLIKGCEFDTKVLARKEAAALASLIEQSGIHGLKSSQTPNACDLTCYEIAVETEKGSEQVSFDDMTLPETLRPLVEYLQQRAKVQPLK